MTPGNFNHYARVMEISGDKRWFKKIKKLARDWKGIVIISVGVLTIKIALEQLAMVIIRGN